MSVSKQCKKCWWRIHAGATSDKLTGEWLPDVSYCGYPDKPAKYSDLRRKGMGQCALFEPRPVLPEPNAVNPV